MTDELHNYIPVALLLLAVLGLAGGMMLTPLILGKKRVHGPVKDSAYECGLPAMTGAHARFSVKFYLIAMLFILFDIEVVFFLGWGAVFRDLAQTMGWEMLIGAAVFLVVIEVGHIYAWKKGALDWAPQKARNPNIEARRKSE